MSDCIIYHLKTINTIAVCATHQMQCFLEYKTTHTYVICILPLCGYVIDVGLKLCRKDGGVVRHFTGTAQEWRFLIDEIGNFLKRII